MFLNTSEGRKEASLPFESVMATVGRVGFFSRLSMCARGKRELRFAGTGLFLYFSSDRRSSTGEVSLSTRSHVNLRKNKTSELSACWCDVEGGTVRGRSPVSHVATETRLRIEVQFRGRLASMRLLRLVTEMMSFQSGMAVEMRVGATFRVAWHVTGDVIPRWPLRHGRGSSALFGYISETQNARECLSLRGMPVCCYVQDAYQARDSEVDWVQLSGGAVDDTTSDDPCGLRREKHKDLAILTRSLTLKPQFSKTL